MSDRAEKRTEGIVEGELEYAHEYISAATMRNRLTFRFLDCHRRSQVTTRHGA